MQPENHPHAFPFGGVAVAAGLGDLDGLFHNMAGLNQVEDAITQPGPWLASGSLLCHAVNSSQKSDLPFVLILSWLYPKLMTISEDGNRDQYKNLKHSDGWKLPFCDHETLKLTQQYYVCFTDRRINQGCGPGAPELGILPELELKLKIRTRSSVSNLGPELELWPFDSRYAGTTVGQEGQ